MGNKFAFIVCGDSQWPEGNLSPESIADKAKGLGPVIYTLRLPGETEGWGGTLTEKLLAAAKKTLPFSILFRYVIFHPGEEVGRLFDEIEVIKIVDAPGAPVVKFEVHFNCERMYYLPRDPVTGEFIDLEKQVQCLSVLKHPADRKK